MNAPSALPTPTLTAISHSGAACFPVVLGVNVLVLCFVLREDATIEGIVAIIGITGFTALLVFSAWWQRRKFLQQSVVTQGAITRLWHEVIEDAESGQSTYYYLAYTFPGGQETRQAITAQQCLFANPGDAVTVRYLPDQPQVSQVDWELTLQEKLKLIENPPAMHKV